jgi:archaemetzincin
MRRFLPLLYVFALCISCNRPKVIYIQPLGHVQTADLGLVKDAVEKFYHYPCIIKPAAGLTPDILADSKSRYEANRILTKYNSGNNTLILTDRDIAAANPQRQVKEWGIFGLGYQPGTTCVVSVFRLKQNASDQVFHQRLIKVCLHEIGHNFGSPHCSSGDSRCLMRDAKGTIKEVDHQQLFLCAQCRRLLRDAGGIEQAKGD